MDIVLMGNTIFEFEESFQKALPVEHRNPAMRHSDYSDEILGRILSQQGFFLGMPPRQQAVEAVRKMMELGHNVKICMTTHPPIENPSGFLEQAQLIQKHFGLEFFANHVLMARDRTFVSCDILVSDYPQGGDRNPTWKLVILNNWVNWRRSIGV